MEKQVNRRDALKLAAAARGEPATDMFFKFYYAGKFWHTVQLTEEQTRQLGENPGALTIKLFRGGAEQVGSLGLTPEVQIKLRSFLKMSR